MTYSAAQAAFVSALQSAAAAGEISDLCDKKDLVKVANSIGKTCIPVWVRRNESLKAGRGLWNIKPLLDGETIDAPTPAAPAPDRREASSAAPSRRGRRRAARARSRPRPSRRRSPRSPRRGLQRSPRP